MVPESMIRFVVKSDEITSISFMSACSCFGVMTMLIVSSSSMPTSAPRIDSSSCLDLLDVQRGGGAADVHRDGRVAVANASTVVPAWPIMRLSKKARIASSSFLRLIAETMPCTYWLVGEAFICICSIVSNTTALSKLRGKTHGRVCTTSAGTIGV
jgi:hypothetical protein